ncbi:bifunctional glycosyltransferase family 2/GtrA family protein [Galbitalea soli]|uniref:dolichyl-phosphate beta-glucosyltransferase n=1 Tax=Galbitalea soli TaxID=1268042 RepID=A0A7C9TT28_9MICO|nr:bifunctional glycosyltransferase family 2/GtrA family protein [Galbitalea soli]NEM92124.1 bifunctional glycosyltransferase family 2/GtrA family protein [Galbitalea soli]NYJ31924.1 glycosyltransferase involved in cell wall biosynthesis [Galbitalea soli]
MKPTTDALALDVVVPVYNEQGTLDRSIRTLHQYLSRELEVNWAITIADNASIDATVDIATALVAELDGVRLIHLDEKGRGRALKRAWGESTAKVVAYLDVDLSTDLAGIPPLIAPLLSGHSDLAIGTRLALSSRVTRGGKREFISRSYNFLLRRTMGVRFSDAQCGFKAMRAEVAAELLPLVEDDGWFFDTELLILAERAGLRIHEVPVDWIDDPDSRVDIASTAMADLRGMLRVGRGLVNGRIPIERVYAELGRRPFEPPTPPTFFGQVIRFGAIGALSTVAYALIYLVLSSFMAGQLANFLALLITAIANTAANRRFTFGVRGRAGVARHQVQGLIVFGLAWLLTSGALIELHAINPNAGATAELIALTFANLLATVLRFVLLRVWVFRSHRRPVDASVPAELALRPVTTTSTTTTTSHEKVSVS